MRRINVLFIALISIILLSINIHILSGKAVFNFERVVGIELCVFLDVPAEAEHLKFLVSVQELTEEGIKPLCETEIWAGEGLLPKAVFNFRVWKEPLYEVKVAKDIWKPVFKPYNIWVYAIASDRASKMFYYGSWSAGIDPHHNQTVEATIRVRARNSSEAPASKVPAPGQVRSWRKDECRGAMILAVSLPEGAYLDYEIKAGAYVSIDSYEKLYWTFVEYASDPDAIWCEEDWSKCGTTSITLDVGSGIIGDGIYIDGPFSHYWYPLNVSFVMATTYRIYEGFYYVFVKQYAIDTFNGVEEEEWSPPPGGTYIGSILRPNLGPLVFPAQDVWSLQSISISFDFATISGARTVSIGFNGGVTFTYEKIAAVKAYIYANWNKASSYANELRVYRFDESASRLEAIFA